jgi:small neutral amino acid transporter SnatA (MarC family)
MIARQSEKALIIGITLLSIRDNLKMSEIISAAVLLILIMDPLGNLPIFMSVLKHTEPKRRRAIMIRELLIALLVMFIFLFAGEKILAFLNLRAETVSISGGIILFLIAIKMIFPSAEGSSSGLPAGEEPFIVPLAIPWSPDRRSWRR